MSATHRSLTRRRLLQMGGAVAVGAFIHAPLSAFASVDPGAPAYLRRSGYLGLGSSQFTAAGNVTMQLTSVDDLPDESVGADDAFSLTFESNGELDQGIQSLSHPTLGSFEMFVVQVGPSSSTYQAIINRTISLGGAVPAASQGVSATTTQSVHVIHEVESVSARRISGGVLVEVALGPGVERVRAWLRHNGKVVGVADVPARGRHTSFRIHTAHRLAGGRYELSLQTVDAAGTQSGAPHSVVLH